MNIKEKIVKDYISSINFKLDDWKYQEIEENLRQLLGERPTLDIKYQKDVMINEDSGEAIEYNRLNSVSVFFMDDDDKIKKFMIYV